MSPELKMMNDESRKRAHILHYSLFILHYLIVLHYSLFILHCFLHRQSYTPRFRPCRHLRTYEDLRRHSRKFEDF